MHIGVPINLFGRTFSWCYMDSTVYNDNGEVVERGVPTYRSAVSIVRDKCKPRYICNGASWVNVENGEGL